MRACARPPSKRSRHSASVVYNNQSRQNELLKARLGHNAVLAAQRTLALVARRSPGPAPAWLPAGSCRRTLRRFRGRCRSALQRLFHPRNRRNW